MEFPVAVQKKTHSVRLLGFWTKYGNQVFASFAANIGAFAFGTTWSWTATALPSLKQDAGMFHLTSNQESLLSAILFLGCLFSSIVSSHCIEKWGRRRTMLLANIPYLISCLLLGFAQNAETIYIARFIAGFSTACYGSAAPLYVAETSNPIIRGRLICTFDAMIAGGMLFMNIVGSFTPWRSQAFICGLIPIIGHICLLIVPESPRFLMEIGKNDEAKKSLLWLQPETSEYDIKYELEEIEQSAAQDAEDKRKYGMKVLFEPSVFKPILVGCMLMFFHQFSGNYPILAYGVDIFSSTGTGNPYLEITTINTAQFMASIIPVFLVDTLGRRSLLIVSEIVMAICLGALGIYFSLQMASGQSVLVSIKWLPTGVLLIYEIFYALGIGPIPWLLMGELISPKKTAVSLGVITAVYRALGFVQLYLFHDLILLLGQDGVYYFFGVCCLIGAYACWAFVPDTTGKTLDEIHSGSWRPNLIRNFTASSQINIIVDNKH